MEKSNIVLSNFLDGRIKLYQDNTAFKFCTDSFLFFNFISQFLKGYEKVIEIGCGVGLISILLKKRFPNLKVWAFDIQEDLVELAKKSAKINKVDINFFVEDVKNIKKHFKTGFFDAVICNPPFWEENLENKPKLKKKKIAFCEEKANLKDFLYAGRYLLKDKGNYFLMIHTKKLTKVFKLGFELNLMPKILRPVYPKITKNSKISFLILKKNSKDAFDILPPLIVYNENNFYTKEVENFYKASWLKV